MAEPVIWWVRRDLRLTDNPSLQAALDAAEKAGGAPVIPVFVLDEVFEGYGACPIWRFGLGVERFAKTLADMGSRLILRRGRAATVIPALAKETGAKTVRWTRMYDPEQVERDEAVHAALKDDGVDGASVRGHVMFEPWEVETQTGGFYKVYSPFWRAVKDFDVGEPLTAPSRIPAPESWPESDDIADWDLARGMDRGAAVTGDWVTVGEDAAQTRLGTFVRDRIEDYAERRDLPGVDGTSGLSENLSWGEISPRSCWWAGVRAKEDGKAGAATFLKELVWREFAYHLVWHTPRLVSGNWREEWDAFPWNEDERLKEVKAWKQGRTGIPFVDAAQREMFVTGRMHNRARMIVASYLTKHLMCHWRIGKEWFEDCLIDWDPANNSLGWQWSAGSGPDATPFFRVFNPITQVDKFDPDHAYLDRWIAEGQKDPPETALSYFDAIPKRWAMAPDDAYPDPVVGHKEGRERALEAYGDRDF